MSIRCDFCDNGFSTWEDLLIHYEASHSNKPIIRFIKSIQPIQVMPELDVVCATPPDDRPVVEALFEEVNQLRARVQELEAAPTQKVYIKKSDHPVVPWGDQSDKAMAEALIWDGHSAPISELPAIYGNYGKFHLELHGELKERLKIQRKKVDKAIKKKPRKKRRKKRR